MLGHPDYSSGGGLAACCRDRLILNGKAQLRPSQAHQVTVPLQSELVTFTPQFEESHLIAMSHCFYHRSG